MNWWRKTNVLAIPLVHIVFEVGNNEDWLDLIRYDTPLGQPVDLHGIDFNMQVRHTADSWDVSLYASTANGMMRVGVEDRFNYLFIHVPLWRMEHVWTTGDYVGDILASDDRFYRVIATFELRVIHGVTRRDY
jgi:hypothetical protein